jgi:hypothetical protein
MKVCRTRQSRQVIFVLPIEPVLVSEEPDVLQVRMEKLGLGRRHEKECENAGGEQGVCPVRVGFFRCFIQHALENFDKVDRTL